MAVQSWYGPLSGLRVWGQDRVPATGACVLAINHIGVLDPIMVGMAAPRTVDYMAKRELFDIPGLRHVIAAFGAFSVRRGGSDRDAIRLARDRLRAERCLGIFVEGTRQPTQAIGTVKPGAAMLALAEDVPVIGVCLQVHHGGHRRPGGARAWLSARRSTSADTRATGAATGRQEPRSRPSSGACDRSSSPRRASAARGRRPADRPPRPVRRGSRWQTVARPEPAAAAVRTLRPPTTRSRAPGASRGRWPWSAIRTSASRPSSTA
jgi:1-acyl-sn-glycerol-3-phosphate acyltransferase